MTDNGPAPSETLERYRELAGQDYPGEADESMVPDLESTFDRGFDPLVLLRRAGDVRGPYWKDLDETNPLRLGVPLDLGTPNQRTGSRLGPRELRRWSKDQGPGNVEVGVDPFEECRIADWGDVVFRRNPYDLAETIAHLTVRYGSSTRLARSPSPRAASARSPTTSSRRWRPADPSTSSATDRVI